MWTDSTSVDSEVARDQIREGSNLGQLFIWVAQVEDRQEAELKT